MRTTNRSKGERGWHVLLEDVEDNLRLAQENGGTSERIAELKKSVAHLKRKVKNNRPYPDLPNLNEID